MTTSPKGDPVFAVNTSRSFAGWLRGAARQHRDHHLSGGETVPVGGQARRQALGVQPQYQTLPGSGGGRERIMGDGRHPHLQIVDALEPGQKATGDVAHSLTMEGVVSELYDVAVIPGRLQSSAAGTRNTGTEVDDFGGLTD